jgi:hypothetical protein
MAVCHVLRTKSESIIMTVFKMTGKPLHKDPPEQRQIQDMPDSHAAVLRTSLADMITETEDGLRDGFTEAEYEAEIAKAHKLEHDIHEVFKAHDCCYGTMLTVLLKIVAWIRFDIADITAAKDAADSVEKIEKEKEA